MKKFYIYLFIIIVSILLLPILSKDINNKKINSTKFTIEGKEYKLLIADNKSLWIKGLSGIKKLKNYDGMLFIFPEKKKRVFWNKNTRLNLKIFWIDGKKIIGKSELPSIESTKEIFSVVSPGKVDKVIELIR